MPNMAAARRSHRKNGLFRPNGAVPFRHRLSVILYNKKGGLKSPQNLPPSPQALPKSHGRRHWHGVFADDASMGAVQKLFARNHNENVIYWFYLFIYDNTPAVAKRRWPVCLILRRCFTNASGTAAFSWYHFFSAGVIERRRQTADRAAGDRDSPRPAASE